MLIVAVLFGLNSVHTEINLELGARLLIINRKSKFLDDPERLAKEQKGGGGDGAD